MPNFIHKRLQVFVSSTYDDLKPERQAAVQAILTAGHIPAGMELFTAGDESQMKVIEQWIDESDVYLLILGGRYGSVEPKSGKSYTELEYEYAVGKGMPVFACIVNEEAQEERVKEHGTKVTETQEPKKLQAFRSTASSKMVRFWDDEKDIKIAVGESLGSFARQEDLVGWVRPTEQGNVAAHADEIARLSKENAELRAKSTSTDILGMSFEDMEGYLETKGWLDFFIDEEREWTSGVLLRGHEEHDKAKGLQARGLLRFSENFWHITEDGVVFLNQHRLRSLVEDYEDARLDSWEAQYKENRDE